MIEIRAYASSPSELQAESIVIWKHRSRPLKETWLPENLQQVLTTLEADGEIQGNGELTVVHTQGSIPAKRIIVAGLGGLGDAAHNLRVRSAEVIRTVRERYGKTIAFGINSAIGFASTKPEEAAQVIAEGVLIGGYTFDRHLSKDSKSKLHEVLIANLVDDHHDEVAAGLAKGQIIADGVNFCKDLSNETPNHMTPTKLADAFSAKVAKSSLKVTVHDEKWLTKQGFGLLTAVSLGSDEPCKLILAEYRGAGKDDPYLALVGKGVTYDTGGYNLKPGNSMLRMKHDMTGAATVMGAMVAIEALKPKINVIMAVPATENKINGKAYVPGDVIKGHCGRSVEIINTDAEGRLALADAMTHVQQSYKLSGLLDVATLTGGAKSAVGTDIMPYLSNHDDFADAVRVAAKTANEPVWELPLHLSYAGMLSSNVADIAHAALKPPSTISAALFLHEFIGVDLPWMHWDIASVADVPSDSGLATTGASGRMTRTLVQLVLDIANEPNTFDYPTRE